MRRHSVLRDTPRTRAASARHQRWAWSASSIAPRSVFDHPAREACAETPPTTGTVVPGAPASTSGGRSSGCRVCPCATVAAYSSAFSSSRTLPGHPYDRIARSASGENRSERPVRDSTRDRSARASGSMSSRRSLSAGSSMGNTRSR